MDQLGGGSRLPLLVRRLHIISRITAFWSLDFRFTGAVLGAAEVRYVGRLSNLQGIETVIIATGLGSPGNSVETIKQKVLAAGGTVEESLTLFSMAPNVGSGSATDIARNYGTKITP